MKAHHLTLLDSPATVFSLRTPSTRLGRGSGNDIVLRQEGVFPTHAVVVAREDGLQIHDLSGEGIDLNRRRVYSAALHAGDDLRLGDAILRLAAGPAPGERERTRGRDATRTAQAQTLHPLPVVGASAAEGRVLARLRLRTQGGFRGYPITAGALFLGSAPDNDVVLGGEGVSRWHARVEPAEEGFVVTDLHSKNGIFINGARVGRAHLGLGGELRIGGATLELVPPNADESEGPLPSFAGLVGACAKMRALFRTIERCARERDPVLIYGETGTGKELIARALHDRSPQHAGPFVAVNCGALPRELVESELFGHERGAFSGAHLQRRGLFEEASGGTLFLDEVAETPLATQAKLLRVLESGEVRRVGSDVTRRIDVRVVAACNKPLSELAAAGEFRLDLLHRLCVLEVRPPPLRERLEDLPLLVRHLLSAEGGGSGKTLSAEALALLSRCAWPGNVRELRNRLRRASFEADGSIIEAAHLEAAFGVDVGVPHDEGAAFGAPLATVEQRHIVEALRLCHGNKAKACKMLGIARSTLFEKVRRYGIKE